jgi:hypothetical protein
MGSDTGVRLQVGVEISLRHCVQTSSGAKSDSYLGVPVDFFFGVKRLGSEADHSPPSSAKVKNAWNYTFIPPVRLHVVVLS